VLKRRANPSSPSRKKLLEVEVAMLPDLSKIKNFTSNGTMKTKMTPQHLHFLQGFKPNTLLGYNTSVKKFVKYMSEAGKTVFALPIPANNVYGFCFWAGRDKGKTSGQ
jgi:hypothetical protein